MDCAVLGGGTVILSSYGMWRGLHRLLVALIKIKRPSTEVWRKSWGQWVVTIISIMTSLGVHWRVLLFSHRCQWQCSITAATGGWCRAHKACSNTAHIKCCSMGCFNCCTHPHHAPQDSMTGYVTAALTHSCMPHGCRIWHNTMLHMQPMCGLEKAILTLTCSE